MTGREIMPGDVLRTDSAEMYVYLGYYSGKPWSMYARPDEGYLYAFLGSAWNEAEMAKIMAGAPFEAAYRARREIDGNGCYTKRPKKFREKVGHTRVDPDAAEIRNAFGLRRLGDRKPSKNARNKKGAETHARTGPEGPQSRHHG